MRVVEERCELLDCRGVGGGRAQDPPRRRRPRGRRRPARPSRPSARRRARARGAVAASWHGALDRAGHVLRAAPAGRTRPGTRRRAPRSRPARNGSKTRCRRSCWPTRTTSGARLTRAVASAPTAFPSPAVVCSERERRLAAADRVAGRQPDDRRPRAARARSAGRPAARRGTAPRSSPGWRTASSGRAGGRPRTSRRGRSGPGQPQTSSATSTIRRSFAHCSSSVSALPSTVDENPHCGERQSCSSGA